MTPKPPSGFEIVPANLKPPAPPPGFEIVGNPREEGALPSLSGEDGAKPYATTGEAVGDWMRTAAQGATLGFSDEVFGGVRSLFTGETYDEARDAERAAVDRYRENHPNIALASELGASLLVPGGAAAKLITKAPSVVGKMARGAGVGSGYGAVAGVGASDEMSDAPEGAWEGAKIGAAVGGALPGAAHLLGRAVTKGGTAATHVLDKAQAARLYMADRLRRAGLEEKQIQAWLDRGQAAADFGTAGKADLPQTIADAAPTTQRVLRGVKVGGDADEVIEPFLANRQAGSIDFTKNAETGGQHSRLYEDLRLALRHSDEAVGDKIGKVSAKRKAEAGELFGRAREQSQPFDLRDTLQAFSLRAMNMSDPGQRKKLLDAVRLFDPDGYTGSKLWDDAQRTMAKFDDQIAQREAKLAALPEGSNSAPALRQQIETLRSARATTEERTVQKVMERLSTPAEQNKIAFGVSNIERFHNAKEALDDMIGSADVRDQGNLKRMLTMLKHDLMDRVFMPDAKGNPTRNAPYREALDKYASRSEMLEAAEMGKRFANGAEELSEKAWRRLSEPEKNMFRSAYTAAKARQSGGKPAGPTTDYTGPFRTPNMGNELRLILPPKAGKTDVFSGGNREKLTELVEREGRMTSTAQRVMGNSSTAEKAVDAIDIGRLGRVARYVKDQGGVMQAAVAGLSDLLERMAAIKGERAKYLAEQLLETDPAKQRAFLQEVEKAYGRAVTTKIVSAVDSFTARFAPAASETSVRRSQAEGRR